MSGPQRYLVGLDLGQARDYSALTVLERSIPTREVSRVMRGADGGAYEQRYSAVQPAHYDCRHLERVPLRTTYPAIVERVGALLASPELRGRAALVVDATGVGRPVIDMLRQARLAPIAITIHGGDSVTRDERGGLRVPKRDLVSVVQVLLQSERLKFAAGLPLVSVLVQEMLAFRVQINAQTAHDSYGAWREGEHDDLVLAVAVAAWYGERPQPQPSFAVSRSYITL